MNRPEKSGNWGGLGRAGFRAELSLVRRGCSWRLGGPGVHDPQSGRAQSCLLGHLVLNTLTGELLGSGLSYSLSDETSTGTDGRTDKGESHVVSNLLLN